MSRSRLIPALANWLAFAATLAVAFFLTPYLIRHLGTSQYDVWCVAEAILAYFTLLDMGLAACLVRGVARHNAVKDGESLNRMASTCLALFSLAGAIALLVGTPVMIAFAARSTEDVLPFLMVMLANLALTLPLSVVPSVLDGLERYTAKSIIKIFFLAIRTAAMVLLVQADASLLPLAVALLIVNVLEHLAMGVLAFRFLPALRLKWSLVNRASYYEIRRYSIDAFLAMLAGRMTVQTGVIAIGFLLPIGAVTVFATASRLVEYAKTLLRTITATLTPGVSALEARGDWNGIRSLFLAATRFVLYLALPIQLGLWCFGTPFLIRWVPDVGPKGSGPLAILAIALTLSVAQSVASRMLYGLGKLKLFARLALAEAALNLLMLVCLIPSLQLTGVALGVALPNVLFNLVVLVHVLRLLEIPLVEYLKAWSKPLLAATVPLGIWMFKTAEPTWESIFSSIALGLLPYAFTALMLEAPKAQPSLQLGLMRRLAHFARRRLPS